MLGSPALAGAPTPAGGRSSPHFSADAVEERLRAFAERLL